jgi:hypothetical protein
MGNKKKKKKKKRVSNGAYKLDSKIGKKKLIK